MQIFKRSNVKLLALTTLLSNIPYSSLNAVQDTYLGAELSYAKTTFQENFGGNVFAKKFTPGFNLFVGHMYNKFLGVEAGAEIVPKNKRETNISQGSTIIGISMPQALPYRSKTWIKQQHIYLGAIAKTNFLEELNSISLMLGFSLTRLKEHFHLHESTPGVALPAAQQRIVDFTKSKMIPIAKLNIERQLYSQFRIRLACSWKNTALFKLNSGSSSTKARNTYGVSFGVIYYL